MDRSPLFTKNAGNKDSRSRRNTQSLLTEATVAAPIGYDHKGRLTVLVEPPLEIRGGKVTLNLAQLKKLLED